MLEVLISLAILSIALIALATLASQSMKATESGKRLTQSLNIANEKLETLKAIPYTNIQSGGTDGNISRLCTGAAGTPPVFTCTPTSSTATRENMIFTWKWTVTYMDLDADGQYYSIAPIIDGDDIKKVEVKVDWTDLFGPHTTALKTLRSRL
ncbi:MAG: hypothetical protein HY883_05625 [Deltaproteobacteria bacterium]|nr:hypothetical protein [Deltaproteobacteria bacterium]